MARKHLNLYPFALGAWAVYVGSVLLANWLVTHYGIVDVAPGPWTLKAPAAVYAVGLALVARDVLHEATDDSTQSWRWWVLSGILVGAVLSLLVTAGNWRIVVGSGAAFALSELIDLGVYLKVRPRWGWTAAAATSSVVGLFADSLVFLSIAFGGLGFFWGQVVGKSVIVAATVALLGAGKAMRRPVPYAAA